MTFGREPSIPNVYKVSQENARAMADGSLCRGAGESSNPYGFVVLSKISGRFLLNTERGITRS